MAVLNGDGGNNAIFGTADDDQINGLGGDDFLSGGDGNDQIDGGLGFDIVDFSDRGVGFQFNLGVTSDASALNLTEIDTLVSIDVVRGTNFNDLFTVDAGFVGDDGSSFASIRGGAGDDTINGNGETRIEYDDATSGVRVDLNAGTAQGILGNAGVGVDTVSQIAQVRGSNFDDILFGSDGNNFESFRGQAGNDFIDGRGGSSDRADYRNSPTAVNIDLEARTGQDGFGTLDFLFNIEDVRGSSFDDQLAGDSGNNVFRGRLGNDAINGRGGFDSADYRSDATAAIIVDLGSVATVTGDLSVGVDSLIGIERVLGSRFSDTFNADAAFDNGASDPDQPFQQLFNAFRGGRGNDVINGNGVTRAEYNDATDGVRVDLGLGIAEAIDVEFGAGIGADTFAAQSVFEVRGSSFDDILTGSDLNPLVGFESFIGDAGNDTIDGGLGTDRVSYVTSTSVNGVFVNLQLGLATDGLGGNDQLISIENIKGSSFGDVLIGSAGNNVIEGVGGSNDIRGGAGVDEVLYDDNKERVIVDLRAGGSITGADTGDDLLSIENVTASVFNDIVVGSVDRNAMNGLGGNDRLVGLSGNDTLNGNSGNDVLFGNSGDDVLVGGAGRDRLIGGFGVDNMSGGLGNDTYFVDSSDDVIVELAGGGTDTVIIAPGTTVGAFANVEIFILDFGPGQDGVLNGLAQAETFIGGSGDDVLSGNGGNDLLIGGAGNDRAFGGANNDTLKGSAGVDLLVGGEGNDVIIGGSGNDVFINGETLDTEAGLSGGAGFDRLNGQSGDDVIEGGAGADRIIGGTGNDQLVGGNLGANGDGAADRFLFSGGSGLDNILDFENGIDQIDFRGLNLETGRFPSFAALQTALSEVNGNSLITISDTDIITILGVTNAQLDATDFIFVDSLA